MKTTFLKCDYCKAEVNDKTGKCVFAIHKRVIGGKEYYFCCKSHADKFVEKKEKKK
jgi:YHS domain-containing protein